MVCSIFNPASHCYLSSETGLCKASIEMYHYDPSTQKCFTFYYSGCGGNDNRFESEELCLANCTKPARLPLGPLGPVGKFIWDSVIKMRWHAGTQRVAPLPLLFLFLLFLQCTRRRFTLYFICNTTSHDSLLFFNKHYFFSPRLYFSLSLVSNA